MGGETVKDPKVEKSHLGSRRHVKREGWSAWGVEGEPTEQGESGSTQPRVRPR